MVTPPLHDVAYLLKNLDKVASQKLCCYVRWYLKKAR